MKTNYGIAGCIYKFLQGDYLVDSPIKNVKNKALFFSKVKTHNDIMRELHTQLEELGFKKHKKITTKCSYSQMFSICEVGAKNEKDRINIFRKTVQGFLNKSDFQFSCD